MIKLRRSLIMAAVLTCSLSTASTPASAHRAAEGSEFHAQAVASGLTIAQAADLQKRVNEILAANPGGKQVSATEVRYDGLNVTVGPLRTAGSDQPVNVASIACRDLWFCIIVQGTRFEFYTCRTWSLSNWLGPASFNNNQSWGTEARAYAQNGTTVVFRNTAKDSGVVNVDPWWYFKPC